MKAATDIDSYIAGFPEEVQTKMQELRAIIHKAAPHANEVISYAMPAFKQNKVLVYFAAYKQHIGFYPTSQPMVVFEKELSGYKTSKGAVQFPLDKPLPKDLVTRMVKFRVEQDLQDETIRKKK